MTTGSLPPSLPPWWPHRTMGQPVSNGLRCQDWRRVIRRNRSSVLPRSPTTSTAGPFPAFLPPPRWLSTGQTRRLQHIRTKDPAHCGGAGTQNWFHAGLSLDRNTRCLRSFVSWFMSEKAACLTVTLQKVEAGCQRIHNRCNEK